MVGDKERGRMSDTSSCGKEREEKGGGGDIGCNIVNVCA